MPRKPDPAFAAVLTSLMHARGLSQADLARRLDVSPTQVSRWTRGLEVPSINRIETITTFFGVDRETLERLAGWRDNSIAGAQDSVDPEIAALLDAERKETDEELRSIPQVFWTTILEAQRSARRTAVDTARAALGLVQSQPINTESSRDVSNAASNSPKPTRRGPRGPRPPLTSSFGRGQDAQQFANSLAVIAGL